MLGQCVYRGRGLGLPYEIKYPSSLLRQLPLQSHPAVMAGQPGRIQRVVHVAPPSSVSSKSSVSLGESYELNAIHPNGILQSQQRLAPQFFLRTFIAPVLARMFDLSLQTAQVPEDWRPSRKKPPHNRPKAIQTHQPHVCRLQNP